MTISEIDPELLVADALNRVNAKLSRLPLIELQTNHLFQWFVAEPLELLLSDLEAVGFVPQPIRNLTAIGDDGVMMKFFEATASRSSIISIEALRIEASLCLSAAVSRGVIYDRIFVDTYLLECPIS
jgi:hypothetical protein